MDSQNNTYLGPDYSDEDIEQYLVSTNAKYRKCSFEQIAKEVALHLNEEKVIGFFRGRAEFGPRALGNRSILADPRSEKMQAQLNLKIKYRESFRPFAPSVLIERVSDYFELDEESPYMLFCADVKEELRLPFSLNGKLEHTDMDMIPILNEKRSEIPAVTHVDFSARIQTVDRWRNPDYYALIKEFEKLTGCGMVVNTSFNVRGEPIVNSPQDAYVCFMRTEIDVLVIGDFILLKEEQPQFYEEGEWREKYELD